MIIGYSVIYDGIANYYPLKLMCGWKYVLGNISDKSKWPSWWSEKELKSGKSALYLFRILNIGLSSL